MKRQTLILVAIGVVLFIAGGAIAFISVANNTKNNTPTVTTGGISTAAVVATGNIPAGTTGAEMQAEGLVSIQNIPQKSFNATDLTNVAELNDEVLNVTVAKGHAISSTQLVPSTTAVALPPHQDEVAVTMSGVNGLAGYLQPGSRVDLYANITKVSDPPSQSIAGLPLPCTQMLMSNIEVVDVSSTSPALSAKNAAAGRSVPGTETLLVAVSSLQAQEITYMTLNETLYAVQTQNDTNPPPPGVCVSTNQYTVHP